MRPEILYAENLLTAYPDRQNLDYVSFSLSRGEILGITGLNDSGLTALADVLTGRGRLKAGSLYLDGEPVVIRSPEQANALGVYEITYNLSVIPTLSISENLNVLRRFSWKNFFIRRRENEALTRAVFENYHIQSDPDGAVRTLSNGQRIELAICRAILCGAQLLVCRDIGEGFSDQERAEFSRFLHQLRDEGFTILMLNSNVSMLFYFADRLAIMRKGMICYSGKKEQTSLRDIFQYLQMDAAAIRQPEQPAVFRRCRTPFRLENIRGQEASDRRSICLEASPGQAVGLLWGNSSVGKYVFQLFSGQLPSSGLVTEDGGSVAFSDWLTRNRYQILCLGMRFWENSVFENLTVAENLALRSYHRWAARGGVPSRRMLLLALRDFAREHDIDQEMLFRYPRHVPGKLREQIVLWRALFDPPKLLVLDCPFYTADENIRQGVVSGLQELKSAGTVILWSNNNSIHLEAYCDRVMVVPGESGAFAEAML